MRGYGVSFDVWGTLLNLRDAYRAIAERIAEELAGAKVEEVYLKLKEAAEEARRSRLSEGWWDARRGAELVASKLGFRVSEFVTLVEDALLADPGRLLLPGARDALEGVARLRVPRCVLGNVLFWPSSLTRKILSEVGLAELLDCMVFSDEIGSSKPAREAFEAVAERMGIPVERLVHVGDRVDEDVAGVLLAGGYGVLAWADISVDFECIHRRLCAVRRVSYTPFIVARIVLG